MTKTVFFEGSIVGPEFLNAINSPRFVDVPQYDGDLPLPPDHSILQQMIADDAMGAAVLFIQADVGPGIDLNTVPDRRLLFVRATRENQHSAGRLYFDYTERGGAIVPGIPAILTYKSSPGGENLCISFIGPDGVSFPVYPEGFLIVAATGVSSYQVLAYVSGEKGVKTDQLADGSVTAPKIADNAITEEKIADRSVSTRTLAPDSVGSDELKSDSVNANILADDSVYTAALQDKAVTADKLADKSVSSGKIEDKAVAPNNMADSSRSYLQTTTPTNTSISTAAIMASLNLSAPAASRVISYSCSVELDPTSVLNDRKFEVWLTLDSGELPGSRLVAECQYAESTFALYTVLPISKTVLQSLGSGILKLWAQCNIGGVNVSNVILQALTIQI